MPTGYTHKLMESGQTFPEFALTCARAFGALIEMREEPNDKPIPEAFQVSDYYVTRKKQADEELAKLQSMTESQRKEFGEAEKLAAVTRQKEWLQKEVAQNLRLDEMKASVEAWNPPSPDHVEMKKFMLDQISISRNSTAYVEQSIISDESKAAEQFYIDALFSAERTAESCISSHAEEVKRTEGRNNWLKQLRDSLT